MSDPEVRQARHDDYEAVAAFTRETWADRGGGDYVPDVFCEWVDTDGDGQRTFVLDAGDDVAGVCQGVLLSEHEAWAQGMRMNPAYRGRGMSAALSEAVFEWAADAGAVVCRNVVFSWNAAGLGQSRAVGFEPAAAFRWAHPAPDADADPAGRVVADPDAAWSYWVRSDARGALRGLALDLEEPWALAELTRERLRRAADDTAVFAVLDGGTRAMAYRTREYDRETDDGTERWAEYGVGAWDGVDAARSLLAAVRADAAALDADRTRVLVPETPRHVTDAAYARAEISEHPDFVFEADLTDR